MISTDTSTATGVLTGPTQTIVLGFYFMANTDLVVTRTRAGVITTLTLDSDYSVNGAGNESGGSITVTGQASGDVITIVRTIDYKQISDYIPLTKLSATTIERDFDRCAMRDQQIVRRVKSLEDNPSTGIEEAPIDGTSYARKDATWVSLAGGGDMLKSTYDSENRGYVDRAVLADTATIAGTITGQGNAATKNVGTTAGTVAAGDDARIVAGGTALQPAGSGASLTGITASQVGAVPTATTVNGHALTGNVSVTATDVGLGNCDNTSDANKPISLATQTALSAKAPLASAALTGTPTAPTADAGTNTNQIATCAFVIANGSSGTGDMTKAVYDTNNDGIVDESDVAGTISGTTTLSHISDAGGSAGLDVGTATGTVAAGDHDHDGIYQPFNSNLIELTNLSGSDGYIRKITNGYELDITPIKPFIMHVNSGTDSAIYGKMIVHATGATTATLTPFGRFYSDSSGSNESATWTLSAGWNTIYMNPLAPSATLTFADGSKLDKLGSYDNTYSFWGNASGIGTGPILSICLSCIPSTVTEYFTNWCASEGYGPINRFNKMYDLHKGLKSWIDNTNIQSIDRSMDVTNAYYTDSLPFSLERLHFYSRGLNGTLILPAGLKYFRGNIYGTIGTVNLVDIPVNINYWYQPKTDSGHTYATSSGSRVWASDLSLLTENSSSLTSAMSDALYIDLDASLSSGTSASITTPTCTSASSSARSSLISKGATITSTVV